MTAHKPVWPWDAAAPHSDVCKPYFSHIYLWNLDAFFQTTTTSLQNLINIAGVYVYLYLSTVIL